MLKNGFRKKLLSSSVFCASVLCASVGLAEESESFDPMGKLTNLTSKVTDATDGRLNLSGYANAHYMIHKGAPDFNGKAIDRPLFQVREASLFADMTITDNILFSTELETSYDFSSKNSSGREDEFEALFNYFYFDVDVASQFDWDTDTYGGLSFRAGRILVPFLSYNENKPNFKQNLMSQPFTAFNVVPVNNVASSFDQFGWTDTGAIVNWNYMLDSGLIDTKFTVMNGLFSEVNVLDANSSQLQAGPTVRPRDGLGANKSDWDEFEDYNSEPAFSAKLSYAPFTAPLDVGVSWYSGAWDNNGDKNLTMYGVHLNYLEKDWTVKGEYVKADVEQTAGINPVTAAGPAAINNSTGDYGMKSWYLEGSYIPYRYGPGDQRFVRLVGRYDDVDTNDKANFNPFDRSRITLGTEWEFLKNMRMRYEFQKHKIDNFDAAPAPFVNSGGSEDVYMHMVSFIMHF